MSWFDVQLAALRASTVSVEFAANWLVQSVLLLVVGLALGLLLRRRGSAIQSAVYRMTLAAALLCPVASWMLSYAGVAGWSIAMPDGFRIAKVEQPVANSLAPKTVCTNRSPTRVTIVPSRPALNRGPLEPESDAFFVSDFSSGRHRCTGNKSTLDRDIGACRQLRLRR